MDRLLNTTKKSSKMRSRKGRLAFGGLVLALTLVAAGCAKKSDTTGSGGATLSISSPTDGASVTQPFTLKVNSSVPLGEPSTGDDHVHLCFDGASCDSSYKLVYGDSFQVDGLTNGSHMLTVSLRNADHSAVGPTATITVTVSGATGGSPTATASPTSGGGYYGN